MIGTTRPARRGATSHVLATVALVLAALLPVPVTAGAAHGTRGARIDPAFRPPPTFGYCTMAIPSSHATIEAHIANAPDFCELISQGLADEVFRVAIMVTPGQSWHYRGAALSCRLQYRQTPGRMVVRNSAAACSWFTRTTTGWRDLASGVHLVSVTP